jgi:ATP-binding cassette, subfamily B, bacterial
VECYTARRSRGVAIETSATNSRAQRQLITGASGGRQLLRNARWALEFSWKSNRTLTLAQVCAYAVQSVMPAAIALATKGVIDTAVRQLHNGGLSLGPMAPWLIFAFVATLSDGLVRIGQDYAARRMEDELNLELNSLILSHAGDLDVSFFEDPASQDMLYRARANSAGNLSRFVTSTLQVVSNLIQIVSLLGILLLIEPLVLVVIVVAAVPYTRFQWHLTRNRYELERSRATKRRWTGYFVSALTDSGAVPEAKILDLAPMMIAKFRALMTEFRDQDHHLVLRSSRGAAIFSTFATTAIYVLFVRVALRVLSGSSTMGDLAIFGAAAARLRAVVEMEIQAGANLQEQMLNISDLRDFFAAEPHIAPTVGERPALAFTGAIEFDRVSFTYRGSQEPTLRDISFSVRPGETVAVVGENGSGKTTLVKLMVRFYDPTSGSVRIDGRDLRTLDPKEIHSQIAFVFQNFGRYEASIGENISYGDWRKLSGDSEQIARIGRMAGIDEMVAHLPRAYETPVGRQFGGFDLSIGQWQRLALARAFAREAAVVIMDEPTSNLDSKAEYDLFRRCRALARGRTTIMISHRFSTVRIADRIIVMDKGRVVEVGSHEELMRNSGYYTQLYDRAVRSESSGAPASD